MSTFRVLCAVEARRALSRRAVWMLIGIAVLGITITGIAVFAANGDFDPTVRHSEVEVARLTDL
jgi:uncharacterized membrane protein (DUF485 family)